MKRETILMVQSMQVPLNHSSMLMEIQFYCHLTTKPLILFSNKEIMPSFSLQMRLKLVKLLLMHLHLLLVHLRIELNSHTQNQTTEQDYSTD
jgi:hypothetical protein